MGNSDLSSQSFEEDPNPASTEFMRLKIVKDLSLRVSGNVIRLTPFSVLPASPTIAARFAVCSAPAQVKRAPDNL